MEIIIRKAISSDCPALMELIQELASFEKAPDEVTATLEHFIDQGFGAHPVWYALVAVARDGNTEKIVGTSLWYMRYSTWKGLRLYLEDLIVTESYRGKGIGKKLFDSTIEEARNLKVTGLMWQVLDWNQPAIEFYKNYGAELSSEWINCSLNF